MIRDWVFDRREGKGQLIIMKSRSEDNEEEYLRYTGEWLDDRVLSLWKFH